MKILVGALATLVSLSLFAGVIESLPKEDKLAAISKAVGTNLADSNIASGTTALSAGKLSPEAKFSNAKEFTALLKTAFKEEFKYHQDEELPESAKLTVKIGNFVDGDEKNGDVYKMTSALMESNDYSPNPEIRESSARTLWAVLRKLPVSKKTLVGHIQTKLEDKYSGEVRSIQYFLLMNSDKKAVQFFTIEGSM